MVPNRIGSDPFFRLKEIRFGRIKAVIWKNSGTNGNGPMFNTTLARLYKDPEADTWKETQSLGRGHSATLGHRPGWRAASGRRHGRGSCSGP